MNKLLLSSFLFIGLFISSFSPCSLQAMQGAYQDKQDVRNATKKIISSPQFRHLKELIKPKFPRSSRGKKKGKRGSQSGSQQSNGQQSNGQSGKENGSPSEGNERNGTSDASTFGGDEQSGTEEKAGSGNEGSGNEDSGNEDSEEDEKEKEDSAIPPPASLAESGLGGGLGWIIQIFFWAIIAAVAMAMIYFIVTAFLDRDTFSETKDVVVASPENTQEEEPEQAPGEIPADVYVTRAREFAAQGLYNEAVAQLLLGAMSNIERAGLIQYRKGLTNRDYLRVIRSNKGPYQAFRLIVRTYEPIGFGRRNANEAHFEKLLAGYQQGFHATLS
ncbi:hypothetical protein MNBD_PLANCTO02-564 [hydrothermal vent metagenome]|uniref:Protein-glutamine gamma-glutamyltransferase-like C-terminal domain-containing protein n=1 Tax=hydrothermal vent metagenome TaxID=652676 RepID=A0A3B1DRN2_9ZZZZ